VEGAAESGDPTPPDAAVEELVVDVPGEAVASSMEAESVSDRVLENTPVEGSTDETPSDETRSDDAPSDGWSGSAAPADAAPADSTPVEGTSAEKMVADDVRSVDSSSVATPLEEISPADSSPVGGAATDEPSAADPVETAGVAEPDASPVESDLDDAATGAGPHADGGSQTLPAAEPTPSDEDPTPPEVAVEEPAVADESDPEPLAGPSGETSAAIAAGASIGAAAAASDTPSNAADEAVPALTLRNVTKTFGELRAVDGIDLTIPAGSFYGLVGPNGAGKTTTLSIIAGLLRADGGTVSINGIDAARQSRAAKKMIGVLPDRLRTFDRLTGRQLLSYYGALRGLPAALVESRAADLARAFDLVDALARPVSDYSAGMTKKVMLAGAMIHSPRLLVLDEPFEAVDPVSSAVILDILGAYVAHGGTVILSSHGMELVERVCSRVAVIVSGQVLAEGTVDEVRGEASLEQRFLELAGGLGDVEGLEWLHTFSG